jgi:hypothetical protein
MSTLCLFEYSYIVSTNLWIGRCRTGPDRHVLVGCHEVEGKADEWDPRSVTQVAEGYGRRGWLC